MVRLLMTTLFLFSPVFGETSPDSLRLLVVTGGPTLRHHLDLVPSSFYTLFEGYDNIEWDHASSDEAAFQTDKLPGYDVLVMYNRSDSLSQESQQNLKSFVESGKGIVILHHALGSYNAWRWWWQEVAAAKYQMKDSEDWPKSEYKLNEQIAVVAASDHPITSTLKSFVLNDETYKKLWISPRAQVLFRTDNPTSDGPLVWVSPYKASRIVIVQPGHTNVAHRNEHYRLLVYQAILWSSGKTN